MSKDSVNTLARFAARRKIDMTLLSDPDSRLITAFGVRDDSYGTTGMFAGIAVPTIFIVGADGTIQHRIEIDHTGPPPVDDVLALLAQH